MTSNCVDSTQKMKKIIYSTRVHKKKKRKRFIKLTH